MEFIDDDFCNETPIRDYKCALCGKKLAFVDSPFGPIPTLELIKKFYADFLEFFQEQKNELAEYTKSEIIEAYEEKQELFNNFLTESQNKFNALDEKLSNKLIDFDTWVDSKLFLIHDKEEELTHFINQIYGSFSETLTFFAELLGKIASITEDYNLSKNQFSEKIKPQLDHFEHSLTLLQNVLPNEEIYSIGMQQTDHNEFFELNKKYASKGEFSIRKNLFDKNWEQLSIDLKSKNEEVQNS